MIQALKKDIVRLCVDANGNHVVQRVLQHFDKEDKSFIFEAGRFLWHAFPYLNPARLLLF